MTIRSVMFGLVLLFAATPSVQAQEPGWSPAQASVWAAVQARWQAWQDDDLDAYLAGHHARWHRWAMRSKTLENRSDIEGFWTRVKRSEDTVAFDLKPVAVETYGGGRFAAVHYVVDETVRLRRARVNRQGRTLAVGHETHIPIRFSDFYVLDNGTWLFVGGYRDGGCALFRGFGTLCGK